MTKKTLTFRRDSDYDWRLEGHEDGEGHASIWFCASDFSAFVMGNADCGDDIPPQKQVVMIIADEPLEGYREVEITDGGYINTGGSEDYDYSPVDEGKELLLKLLGCGRYWVRVEVVDDLEIPAHPWVGPNYWESGFEPGEAMPRYTADE